MVEIKAVRLAIGQEMNARGWVQDDLASRSGLEQSHISKILRVGEDPTEMKDLSARVLFQIIERGFGLTLPLFFARFPGQQQGTESAEGAASPTEQERHEPSSLASDAISRATFDTLIDKLGDTLQRSIVDGIKGSQPQRKRKDSTRKSAKPKSRAKNRKDARRRA